MMSFTVILLVLGILLLVVIALVILIPLGRSLGRTMALKVPEDGLRAVLQEVEATGPAFISFSCKRNYFGAVSLNDAAVTFEGHPGGLVVRPSSMHHFALRKADISGIERRPVANQTMLLHTSAQVAPPIVINMPFESDEIQTLVSGLGF